MIEVRTTARSAVPFTVIDHETDSHLTLTIPEALRLIDQLKDAYERLRREEQPQGDQEGGG